jgi:hypothetical protein
MTRVIYFLNPRSKFYKSFKIKKAVLSKRVEAVKCSPKTLFSSPAISHRKTNPRSSPTGASAIL